MKQCLRHPYGAAKGYIRQDNRKEEIRQNKCRTVSYCVFVSVSCYQIRSYKVFLNEHSIALICKRWTAFSAIIRPFRGTFLMTIACFVSVAVLSMMDCALKTDPITREDWREQTANLLTTRNGRRFAFPVQGPYM